MATPTERTFSYIRASTGKQQLTAEAQRETIAQFIACRQRLDEMLGKPPLPPLAAEFVDALENHVSGKVRLADRKAGSAMLAEVRAGDHIIVAKLDRIGRRALDILASIEYFDEIGVTFHFLNFGGAQEIDTSTPAGKLFLTQLAAFAEFERAMIGERSKAVIDNLRRRGAPTNKPPTGMAIKETRRGKSVEKRYVWDDRKRREMEIAHRMHVIEGIPVPTVTKYLNQLDALDRGVPYQVFAKYGNRWSVTTVWRLIQQEKRRLAGICPVAERAASVK